MRFCFCSTRSALEGKRRQRRFQKRLVRCLERVPNPLRAVTVGYKCHGSLQLRSGKEQLWGPWRAGGGGYPPLQHPHVKNQKKPGNDTGPGQIAKHMQEKQHIKCPKKRIQ